MSFKQRVIQGMAISVGGFGLKTLLNLALIPLIITQMGPGQYGVYILLITVIEMVADLANGLTNTVVLLLGQSMEDAPTYRAQLRTGLWAHITAAMAVFVLGMVLMPVLLSQLNWPVNMQVQIPWLLAMALLEGCLFLFSGFFKAVLSAHTRLGVFQAVETAQAIACNMTIAWLLWALHMPLGVLVGVRCAFALVSLLTLVGLSRKEWGIQTDWHPGQVSASQARQFWDISWVSTANMMLLLISCRLDGMIIGSMLNMTAVAVYGIVQRIYGQSVFLGFRVASVVFPVMTRLSAQEDPTRIRAFFLRACQGLGFFAGFMALWLTWFFKGLFAVLSQGKLPADQALPVVWLMVPYVFVMLATFPANSFLYTRKQQRLILQWASQSALVNLAISLLTIPLLGMAGAALGTLVALTWDRVLRSVPKACQLLDIPLLEYWQTVLWRNVPSLVTAWVVIASADALLMTALPVLGRFFVAGAASGLASGLVWALTNLPQTDRQALWRKCRLKTA
jgi:O-antigen/teichoic acid export membrane protein